MQSLLQRCLIEEQENGLGDFLKLESVNLEIAIADLYHQVQFS